MKGLTHIGTIVGTMGVRGFLKIKLNYDPTLLSQEDHFFLILNNKKTPFFFETIEAQVMDILLVKVEDIESKEDAELLIKKDVYLPSSKVKLLPKIIDFAASGYLLKVIEPVLEFSIIDFYNIPNNPLLEIIHNDKKVLLPFHSDFVSSIDHEMKEITYKLDLDLLEL